MSDRVDEANVRSEEFEKMVLEHLNMMYAVALRLTRNAMDAQDLTQNAVVKALRFHDRFQDGTYIKAWLLTILRNTFINEYRSKAAMRRWTNMWNRVLADVVAKAKPPYPPSPTTATICHAYGMLAARHATAAMELKGKN